MTMNRALIFTIACSVLCGLAFASNTIFIETGLPANTFWNVNVWTYQNSTFNHNFNTSSSNTISVAIPTGSYYYTISTNSAYPTSIISGKVSVGGTMYVNFNAIISANSVSSSTYNYCSPSQISLGPGACISYEGAVPNNATQLQSTTPPNGYSANLTIYVNPAGYYEYVLTNSTTVAIQPQIYQNVLPGDMVLPPINLTNFNKLYYNSFNSLVSNTVRAPLNSSYTGAIFYSQQIDISPIEWEAQGLNNTQLTPQNFFYFVEQNSPSFANTTLIFHTNNLSIIGQGILATPDYVTELSGILTGGPVGFALGGIIINSLKQTVLKGAYGEVSTSAQVAIPVAFANMQNTKLPLFVSYAYPNNFCISQYINGICIEKGSAGMLDFNNYIDTQYAPEILQSQFVSYGVGEIMMMLISIVFIKRLNGDN